MKVIINSLLFTVVFAVIVTGCQKANTEDDAMLKKSVSADESYLLSSFTPDGYNFELTIEKNPGVRSTEAKSLSHLIMKFAACCPTHDPKKSDTYWLMDNIFEHLISLEVNGFDHITNVKTYIWEGTGCWFPPLLDPDDQSPWDQYAGRVFKVNIGDGLSFPLTIKLKLDQQAAWGTVLLKADSDFCGSWHNDGEPWRFPGFCNDGPC